MSGKNRVTCDRKIKIRENKSIRNIDQTMNKKLKDYKKQMY